MLHKKRLSEIYGIRFTAAISTSEAEELNEEISNLPEYISATISMSSQLGTWRSEYDFDTCQSIQKLVHPLGIYWDNEKKFYLTIEKNDVFSLFRSISSDYETVTKEKQDKSFDLSCLVDYTDKSSNFFEDLLKLDRFAQSVEDELNRIVVGEEGSRDDP